MKRIRVALIGAGLMASNHARVISQSYRATLGVVVDIDQRRAQGLASHFGADVDTRLEAIRGCDAAVIASPTETHAPIALFAIESGKHVLIEKPLAPSLAEVKDVCSAALNARVALCCGFVERFNPVVQAAGEMLGDEPIHLVAIRHSPTNPRTNESVIHDLLIHDLDLAMRF